MAQHGHSQQAHSLAVVLFYRTVLKQYYNTKVSTFNYSLKILLLVRSLHLGLIKHLFYPIERIVDNCVLGT